MKHATLKTIALMVVAGAAACGFESGDISERLHGEPVDVEQVRAVLAEAEADFDCELPDDFSVEFTRGRIKDYSLLTTGITERGRGKQTWVRVRLVEVSGNLTPTDDIALTSFYHELLHVCLADVKHGDPNHTHSRWAAANVKLYEKVRQAQNKRN